MVGRVGHHVVERSVDQRRPAAPSGRLPPVAAEWRCRWRRNSAGRSPASSASRSRPTTMQPGTRAARHSAAAPVPVPTSSTVSAGFGRDGGGEQHGVDRGSVAAPWLAEPQPAAEQPILAQLELSRGWSSSRAWAALASTHKARSRSSSSTSNRRGKAPMPPSTLLMWLSRSRQSIPPPPASPAPRRGGRDRCCEPLPPSRSAPLAVARTPRARGFAIARGAC